MRHVGKAKGPAGLVYSGDAAEHIGVSIKTLRKWADGYVPVVRDPDSSWVRYSIPALDRWLEDNCPCASCGQRDRTHKTDCRYAQAQLRRAS